MNNHYSLDDVAEAFFLRLVVVWISDRSSMVSTLGRRFRVVSNQRKN